MIRTDGVGTLMMRVRGGLKTAHVGSADTLVAIARYGVLAFAVVAALSQLEIAGAISNWLSTAVIGGVTLAMALAFDLGARDAAGSIATGQMIKSGIQSGMQISMDGQQGSVEKVGAVYTTVRTSSGTALIPNAELARITATTTGGAPAQPPVVVAVVRA